MEFFFLKVTGFRTATLLNKDSNLGVFTLNFAELFKIAFLPNIPKWLPLKKSL